MRQSATSSTSSASANVNVYRGQRLSLRALLSGELKSIDAFRADPKYSGDGTRIDLAYAIYALSRGVTEVQVEAALRSRDLSHKGCERRQIDYVERTIRKALGAAKSPGFSR